MPATDPLYADLDREMRRREKAMHFRSGRAMHLVTDLLLRYRALPLGHPDTEGLLDTVDALNDTVRAEADITPEREAELRLMLLDSRR